MKKIILALLLISGFVQAETAIDPKEPGPFEPGRLIYQSTTSVAVDRIITDLKTGCQYMQSGVRETPAVPLGCFPELVDPKFKK